MYIVKNTIIAFDAKRIVNNNTGLGNYSRTLVNDLAVAHPHLSLQLYTPDSGRDDLRNQVVKAKNITFCYPQHITFGFQKMIWRHRGMVKQMLRDGVKVYHGLSGELPVGIKASGIKTVVTIHDLIFLRHPQYYNTIDAWIYKRKFISTCNEANYIIAISQRTKQDILAFSNYPEEQIKVIYQGCGTNFRQPVSNENKQKVRIAYHLPQRYVLNVGTIEERKNVLLAVKALQHLPQDVSLVIVGKATPYLQKVKKYAEKHHLSHRICILHGVSNGDLPAIYQQAECFVYPSRYEGFGIPIIEAIQSGLPVVACTGSCLEEAGGPDSLYVHPDDNEGLAKAISTVLIGAKGRDEKIDRSKCYVERFENINVAEQVAKVYEMLLQ